MPTAPRTAHTAGLARLLGAADHELRLAHHVVRRDLSAAFFPALIFALAARVADGGGLAPGALALAACAAYFGLFIYGFCLDNQIRGVDEDRLNKPDRAIPAGRLSLDGARRRRTAVLALFVALGLALGVPLQSAAWVALTALNHHAGWDRHWFTKNIGVVGLGAIAQLFAAWTIAAPAAPCPWTWILALAATLGVAMCIQDFRDVAGDALLRRRTLPLAIGEIPARALCAIALALLPLVLHAALIAAGGVTPLEFLFDATFTAFCAAIAHRVWTRRTPRDDDRTYRLLPRLYCAELAFAALLIV